MAIACIVWGEAWDLPEEKCHVGLSFQRVWVNTRVRLLDHRGRIYLVLWKPEIAFQNDCKLALSIFLGPVLCFCFGLPLSLCVLWYSPSIRASHFSPFLEVIFSFFAILSGCLKSVTPHFPQCQVQYQKHTLGHVCYKYLMYLEWRNVCNSSFPLLRNCYSFN